MAIINGTSGNDSLLGGVDPDELYGFDGNDTLDGAGGINSLFGGMGNDTAFVSSADDLFFEDINAGTDLMIARVSAYLFANVENLRLSAGAGDIFGVGNDLSNIIEGNEGNNLLLGGGNGDVISGGAGVDLIYGEDGNDRLNGGTGIDYLVGGNGNDTIAGAADPDEIYGEDGDDLLIGGDADFVTDIIVGGAGNDTIDGDSGFGDFDVMNGGIGNDTYLVDTPFDLTYEASNEGTDTVMADVNGTGYYLYLNVENLTLLRSTPFGVGNELSNVLTGNAIGNVLLGGDGNDTINGMGGNDVLLGEAGADLFFFQPGTGGDSIFDFAPGVDKIRIQGFGISGWTALQGLMFDDVENNRVGIILGFGDFIVIDQLQVSQLSQSDFLIG